MFEVVVVMTEPVEVPDGGGTAVFDGLAGFEAMLVGADTDPFEPDGIPFLRFTDEAQIKFDEWRARLEAQVRSGDEHPAIESHLAKYRSLIPSLSLLIHLTDGGTGPVGIGPLQQSIGWGVYLESHARRIYSQAVNPDLAAARKFYEDTLGFGPPAYDLPDLGWVEYASELGGGNVALTTGEWENGSGQRTTVVLNTEDTAKTCALLRARGVECEDPVTVPGYVVYCVFRDPFGNRLQMCSQAK